VATRYFPQNTDVDAGCNAGAATGDHDLSTTQGTSTGHTTDTSSMGAFTLIRSYQVDVTGDSPVFGSQSFDLSVDITALSKSDIRFRLAGVDDTGCVRTNVSGWQTYLEVAGVGIKTFSLTLDFTAADEDLELQVEAQNNSAHGGRTVTINVQDADTWVDAPWPAAAGGSKQVAIL